MRACFPRPRVLMRPIVSSANCTHGLCRRTARCAAVVSVLVTAALLVPAARAEQARTDSPFATDLLASPAVGEPVLGLSVNQSVYGPGQRLTLGVSVQNPGGGPVCDFFVVVRLPDGTTVVSVRLSASPAFGSMANLRSLQPVAARIDLAGGFAVSQPLFQYTFNGSEPLGDYLIFFAAVRTGALADGVLGPGELLAVQTQAFRFTNAPAVATVEIQQTGVLLTEIGTTRQLSATAKDKYGNLLPVPIVWGSTRPNHIAVDGTGLVRAETANGSSQIIAEAGGIRSGPLLVVVTPVAPGALLITDTQVVGAPVETTPNAPPSFDNTYRVTLSGVSAPAIGSILINTGSQPVAGRVVSVDVAGDRVIATLALVPLPELFPSLVVDEVLDLAQAPVAVSPDIAAAYTVERSGNTFTFTPRPAVAATADFAAPTAAIGTSALPPPPYTECGTTITGFQQGSPLPVQLSIPPRFSVTINPTLDILYTPSGGLERFVVRAEPTAKVEGGLTLTAAIEGKIECTVELFAFRVPVGGPLSLVIGGLVPVGVGFEAGGKVTLATLGLGYKVEAKTSAAIGIACPGGVNCALVKDLGAFSVAFTPNIDAPGIGDVRLEPSVSAFGFVKASIGNPFFKSLRFDASQAKIGGKLQGSFALKASQLADPAYRSDYKVSLDAGVSVGANLSDVLKLLGLSSVTALELTVSTELAKSPAPAATAAVTADRASFTVGDTVNFRIKLDPAAVNFFPGVGPYNVDRILLVRGKANPQVVGTKTASSGDTEFTIPFAAPGPGTVEEFSAFVITRLLPFDLLALELGAAVPSCPTSGAPADRVRVAGAARAAHSAQDEQCVETIVDIDTFRADGSDILAEGPVLEAGVQYRITVKGTFSVHPAESWARNVCPVTEALPIFPSPDTVNGPIERDPEYGDVGVLSTVPGPHCTSTGTDHTARFEMNLGGGGVFTHIEAENVGTSANSSHTYVYTVTGQGHAIVFRVRDDPTDDNYGILRATIVRP